MEVLLVVIGLVFGFFGERFRQGMKKKAELRDPAETLEEIIAELGSELTELQKEHLRKQIT